jgi:hypothetical protein
MNAKRQSVNLHSGGLAASIGRLEEGVYKMWRL